MRALNLSKCYKLYSHPWHPAAEWALLGQVQRHTDFWALRNVTFHLERGECLGIIGPNGAGKTTLLKILSRALYPTAGNFEVRGRTVSLLELGTGFNLQLTGTQKFFTSARLLGFTDEYVKSRLEAIVEFSELGEFMDRPIQIYSTGMFLRLAFSLFACLEPDVYTIDEALGNSAGDGRPKAVIPQFEMYAESPLKVRRLWIFDEHQKMKSEFQSEEDFEVVLEYDCTEAIRQPIFRVVFALPDERRVSVVGWHPGEGDLEPGTGLIRWRVDGGVLYPRKYVLHASISTWDGVVYDTHYGIGNLLIQANDLGPVFRVTDDLSAFLKYSVRHEP